MQNTPLHPYFSYCILSLGIAEMSY